MHSDNKLDQLSHANLLLKDRQFESALEAYNEIINENPDLSELLAFNIKVARSRVTYEKTNTASISNDTPTDIKTAQVTFIPANDEISDASPTNINYHLSESNIDIRPTLVGNIDLVDDNYIHGWIYDHTTPGCSVNLDLYAGHTKISTTIANNLRIDVHDASGFRAECGFSLRHSDYTNHSNSASLTIRLSESQEPAFSSTINISVLSGQISSLSKLGRILKSELFKKNDPSLTWLSEIFLPSSMARVRKGELIHGDYNQRSTFKNDLVDEKIVSVIIPVYDGFDETINCINSVLKSQDTKQFQLIVINDKSPNQRLTNYLQRHASAHNYALYENSANLGFVGTVNRGMRLAERTDVILLNSDTLVPKGWVDQLIQAAYSDPIIGTVTPFSNNATICSFPNFCQDNIMPKGHDVESLNSIFKAVNSGHVVDLPTAHGFCMYIKRATLDEVGCFDEQTWGKGYAEENDFSLRAEQRGWRNVFDVGTFVQHLGSVSFAENAEAFTHANAKILNSMYPDYPNRVAQFVRLDPARKHRNVVAAAILKEFARKLPAARLAKGNFVLFVSLTIGGGTEVATNEIREKLHNERIQTLMLTTPNKDIWRLEHRETGVTLDFNIVEDMSNLIELLKSLSVWHINYHNTLEFTKQVWDLPELLNCEYDITIHDYLSICPRINLVSNDKYCGEPSTLECQKCLTRNGTHESSRLKLSDFGNDVAKWRSFYHDKLKNSRLNFAPSQDVVTRLNRYFSDVTILTKPHPEPRKKVTLRHSRSREIVNIAFIGAIGVHKGYDYLIGCANYAQANNLPMHFHVIGYTKDDLEAGSLSNITIHGKYDRTDLPALVSKAKCDVAALLSIWPETFSYTFSEALSSGLKIVTFDIGATAERLQSGAGDTVQITESYEAICLKLLEVAKLPSKTITIGTTYKKFAADYYHF